MKSRGWGSRGQMAGRVLRVLGPYKDYVLLSEGKDTTGEA